MWFSRLACATSLVSACLLASGHAKPLTTTASTTATMQVPEGEGESQPNLLIHVLRTEDLIDDKSKDKPLLLEKLSHLIIRVKLGNDTVSVNDQELPVLAPSGSDSNKPLEVKVQLKQVQMLKLPRDSPLVPLGLTKPELLNLSDKYMSEGLLGAVLTVKQEKLDVQAFSESGEQVDAAAYKVTVGMKILELNGHNLDQTNLPPVDLLHLIVHADPADPSKVATMTTMAPPQLTRPDTGFPPIDSVAKAMAQAFSPFAGLFSSGPFGSALDPSAPDAESQSSPSSLLGSAFKATAASMNRLFEHIGKMASDITAQASDLVRPYAYHHHPGPCRHHHHSHHAQADAQAAQPEIGSVTEPAPMASESVPDAEIAKKPAVGETAVANTLFTRLLHFATCLVKAATRWSFALLCLGLPVLASAFAFVLLRAKRDSSRPTQNYNKLAQEDDLKTVDVIFDGENDVEKV